jgi:hypothetical protein
MNIYLGQPLFIEKESTLFGVGSKENNVYELPIKKDLVGIATGVYKDGKIVIHLGDYKPIIGLDCRVDRNFLQPLYFHPEDELVSIIFRGPYWKNCFIEAVNESRAISPKELSQSATFLRILKSNMENNTILPEKKRKQLTQLE